MPGAPNRPPEGTPPPAPPVGDPPEKKALRRLVPSHVALLLDSWKGAIPPELSIPFGKAEAAFGAADYAGALSALDLLAIRFAEPRWPSLPEPFRPLRVTIRAPVPPHWDPDHALSPEEREARQARRRAEEQVRLLDASIEWAGNHGIDVSEIRAGAQEARAALETEGVASSFYPKVDSMWAALRIRLPQPKTVAGAAPRAAAPVESEEA
jgi:hypothetical protein